MLLIGKLLRILPFTFILFVFGCSSEIKREINEDGQFYFKRGMNYMEKKDYIKAISDFQTVVD